MNVICFAKTLIQDDVQGFQVKLHYSLNTYYGSQTVLTFEDDRSVGIPRSDPPEGDTDSSIGVTGMEDVLFADKGMTTWVQKKDTGGDILFSFCDWVEFGVRSSF